MTRTCVAAALFLAGCNFNRESPPEPGPTVVAEPSLLEVAPPPRLAKPIVELTPAASSAVRRHLADNPETNGCYLRVRVVAGGCQGFMHKLDLDQAVSAEDHTFESGGVMVVVAARQIGMIRGTTVDFGEEKGQVGFKVKNPNFEGGPAKRCLEELEAQPVAK